MTRFITHARTPEEAIAEFVSDLNRRATYLQADQKRERTATGKARLQKAIAEITGLADYWSKVEVVAKRRIRTKPKEPQA